MTGDHIQSMLLVAPGTSRVTFVDCCAPACMNRLVEPLGGWRYPTRTQLRQFFAHARAVRHTQPRTGLTA
jgi:hypothetical protein